jgi:hypothetical protein
MSMAIGMRERPALNSQEPSHAISFIHDQVSHSAQIHLLCFEHVNKATGSSNDNLDASLQVTDLGAPPQMAVLRMRELEPNLVHSC